ncbi:alkaline phosphatase, tissue-nonspecific isozyme [Trichonephila clavipes]|nr:alkaline phosphatase, tissue-nonspecific isozyme [Trichonephila clavipes]
MEGDSGRGELAISAVSEKIKSKFVQADEKLVCYWSSGVGLDNKESDVDNMPYTTLLYANGPGYNRNFPTGRENLSSTDTEDINYVQQSAVPRRWDTHGGEDVPVYAHGPMAHLFRGVLEQTYIPHAMAYAACIGHHRDDCERRRRHAFHRQVIDCPSPHVESLTRKTSYDLFLLWLMVIGLLIR